MTTTKGCYTMYLSYTVGVVYMPLIEGICKKCGGKIKFDDNREKGYCPFCGVEFIKEDLIINNHYHNDFSGANVILNDINSVESQLKNAEVYLTKIKDYDKAEQIYRSITEKYSADYRGWWGLVRALSCDLKLLELNEEVYNLMHKYAQIACNVSDDEKTKRYIKTEWDKYNESINDYLDECNTNLGDCKNQLTDLENSISDLNLLKNKSLSSVEKIEHLNDIIDKIEYVFSILLLTVGSVIFGCLIALADNSNISVEFIVSLILILIFILLVKFYFKKKRPANTENLELLKNRCKSYDDKIKEVNDEIWAKKKQIEKIEFKINHFSNLLDITIN